MKIAVTNAAVEAMKRRIPFEPKEEWLREFITKVVTMSLGNVKLPPKGEKFTLKLDRLLTSFSQDVHAVLKNEGSLLVLVTIISQQSVDHAEARASHASKPIFNESLKLALQRIGLTGKPATSAGSQPSSTSSSSSHLTGQPFEPSRRTKA